MQVLRNSPSVVLDHVDETIRPRKKRGLFHLRGTTRDRRLRPGFIAQISSHLGMTCVFRQSSRAFPQDVVVYKQSLAALAKGVTRARPQQATRRANIFEALVRVHRRHVVLASQGKRQFAVSDECQLFAIFTMHGVDGFHPVDLRLHRRFGRIGRKASSASSAAVGTFSNS